MPTTPPTLTGAIFSNSHQDAQGGKLDCKGIFTSFLAWSYPTVTRNWHAILTIHDTPKTTSTLKVAISRKGTKKELLTSVEIPGQKINFGTTVAIQLRYRFPAEGRYNITFSLSGSKKSLTSPIYIRTNDWPKFSKKQILFLKENQAIQHSMRANVSCANCSHQYTFEESVFEKDKLPGGVFPFPKNGEHECETCGHILYLRDVQGQLREAILNTTVRAMKGGL